MLLATTHGAGPSLAVIQPDHMQKGANDALAEVQRRKPWLTHKRPEPWGAMLLSDNTRTFYGRSSGQVEDFADVLGVHHSGPTNPENKLGKTGGAAHLAAATGADRQRLSGRHSGDQQRRS